MATGKPQIAKGVCWTARDHPRLLSASTDCKQALNLTKLTQSTKPRRGFLDLCFEKEPSPVDVTRKHFEHLSFNVPMRYFRSASFQVIEHSATHTLIGNRMWNLNLGR